MLADKICHFRRIYRQRSLYWLRGPKKNSKIQVNDTTCPHTVAAAAPRIPQFKTKMVIGATVKFKNAPMNWVAMAVLGWPEERIKLFIPAPTLNRAYPGSTICM